MAGGLLFHRLKFAHVSALVCAAALMVALRCGGGIRKFALASAMIAGISIAVFPYARAAIVALICGVVAVYGCERRSLVRAAVATIVLVCLGGIVVGSVAPLRHRFVSALTEQGNGQREHLLRAAFRAIDQHPWTGIGLGQFRPSKFAGVDAPKEIIDHPGKAHNQLVSIAAEVGVGGAIVFLVMLGSLLRRAWKTSYGSMTMGAVCIFAVLSTTHDPLFHAPFSMALVLAIGLGLRDQRVGDSGPTSTPT